MPQNSQSEASVLLGAVLVAKLDVDNGHGGYIAALLPVQTGGEVTGQTALQAAGTDLLGSEGVDRGLCKVGANES